MKLRKNDVAIVFRQKENAFLSIPRESVNEDEDRIVPNHHLEAAALMIYWKNNKKHIMDDFYKLMGRK